MDPNLLGTVFIVQAGMYFLADLGFMLVFWIFRRNGNQGFSELVDENDNLQPISGEILEEENE